MFRGDGNLLTSLLLGQKSAASESLPSSHLKTNVLPHVVESVCRILFETRRNHNCSRQRSCVLRSQFANVLIAVAAGLTHFLVRGPAFGEAS